MLLLSWFSIFFLLSTSVHFWCGRCCFVLTDLSQIEFNWHQQKPLQNIFFYICKHLEITRIRNKLLKSKQTNLSLTNVCIYSEPYFVLHSIYWCELFIFIFPFTVCVCVCCLYPSIAFSNYIFCRRNLKERTCIKARTIFFSLYHRQVRIISREFQFCLFDMTLTLAWGRKRSMWIDWMEEK